MTATQVISRFLKEKGLYTKYFQGLKDAYLGDKKYSMSFQGYGFLRDIVLNKDIDENKMFIDFLMAYHGLRIIDVPLYIPYNVLNNYREKQKLCTELYKYAIAKLTKNQLRVVSLFGKKAGFLTYEYKDNAWEK